MNIFPRKLIRNLAMNSLGIVAIGMSFQLASAQECYPDKPTVGKPVTGVRGVTETVAQIMDREAQNPMFFSGRIQTARDPSINFSKIQNQNARAISQWPKAGGAKKAGDGIRPLNPQPVGLSFLGGQQSDSIYRPPDSNGDVGPTQIVVAVNGYIRSFNKSNGIADGALASTIDNFFPATIRNNSAGCDQQVRYDRLSGRWIIVMITFGGSPYRICFAVSNSATISSSASFTFYYIETGGALPDYPSLGVDGNALYVGANMFAGGSSFAGTNGYVVQKTSVLSGGPIVFTAFANIGQSVPAPNDGPFAPRGVDQDDPAATEGYFIGVGVNSFGTMYVRRVSNPGGVPTISGNILVTGVATTANPISVPALGSVNPLAAVDDRTFYAQMRKNRLTGQTTLWLAHNIQVNTSGVASSTGGRTASRWYEIQNMTGAPAVKQLGTLYDSAASNPVNYWIPSIAMSGQGHAAIGISKANALIRADCAAAGRLSSDGLGTLQTPTQVTASSSAYNNQATNPQRWGDYSNTRVDPTDDMTIWSFQEYCNATNSWGVQVFRLIAPPPAGITTLAPNTITQGATANILVTGASAAGSGFFDTEPGMNRLAAAFSGSGLTVNTITFTDPTHFTINVTASGGASLGLRNLTVTNPDGQVAVGSNVLTVVAGSNPLPTTTNLVPNTKNVGDAGFPMTVNGTNFVPTSVVRFNGSDRVTSYVNAGQLTATIPASDMLVAGPNSITVFNPLPGGGTSNAQTFTVNTVFANVQPSSLTVSPGSLVSPSVGLSDVLVADDTRLIVRPGAVFINTSPPIVEILEGTAPFGSLTSMTVNFEGHSNVANIQMITYAWNFNTLVYDQIDSRVMSPSDNAFSANVPSPNDHKDGANLMRIRITCKANSATFTYPWYSRADLIGWTVGN